MQSDDQRRDIDLAPHEWRSEDARPKPSEPLFGAGLPFFICVVVSVAAAAYFKGDAVTGAVIGVILGAVTTLVFNATKD